VKNAFVSGFGAYLPSRVVTNAEIASRVGRTTEWILQVSGIAERRYAADDEDVADMAAAAGQDCLQRIGVDAGAIGLLLVSSGSSSRRFPGPAPETAKALGLGEIPAIDLPLASAGSLFGMALAADLATAYGNVLVIASEKMSAVMAAEPADQNTTILFGDGAGACLISPSAGSFCITDTLIQSDGSFARDLALPLSGPLSMNGRSVIMQASRKMPRAIVELLTRNHLKGNDVGAFLLHQANQNLIDKVARSVGVESGRFFSNIERYGNTSSASMLIAAAEWAATTSREPGRHICFTAFGAGFHWGALLAREC